MPNQGEGTHVNDETSVALTDIYDYVTPEELERFENYDWELECKRERERPKLGRPRKVLLQGVGDIPAGYKPKRPPGRPRKYPVQQRDSLEVSIGPQKKLMNQTGSAFGGVHILSPNASAQATPNSSHHAALTPSRLESKVSLGKESSVSTGGDGSASDLGPSILVDQLTPSNMKKVISAKRYEPDEDSRNHKKASYSMVQAALGDDDSSTGTSRSPDPDSEDELSMNPIQPSGHSLAGREVRDLSKKENQHGSLSLTPIDSVREQSSHASSQGELVDEHDSLFHDSNGLSPTNPADLLAHFKAINARRIKSRSPSSISTEAHRQNTRHMQFRSRGRLRISAISPRKIPEYVPPANTHSDPSEMEVEESRDVPPCPARSEAQHQAPGSRTKLNTLISNPNTRSSSNSNSDILLPVPPSSRRKTPPPNQRGQDDDRTRLASTPNDARLVPRPAHDPHLSTPRSSRQGRQSMTPHFPSQQKSRNKGSTNRLRGGKADRPVTAGSPSKFHGQRQKPAVLDRASILSDRDQIYPLLDARNDAPNEDNEITLGKIESSSDDNGHGSRTKSRFGPSSFIQEIFLGTPITSPSSEPKHQPRVDKPSRSRQVSETNDSKKRRRASDEERTNDRGWFRMLRR
ncbi:MAG: hypothetical protein Q9219_005133 [cf. Caloplaca sp. 3 TL-2023]